MVSFTDRTLYPQGMLPWYPLKKKLSGRFGAEKTLLLLREIEA
jgi:hypothetical protein